jgi:hypothetical protein
VLISVSRHDEAQIGSIHDIRLFVSTDSIGFLALNSAVLGGTNSGSASLARRFQCSPRSCFRPVYIVGPCEKRDTSNGSAANTIYKWRVIPPTPFAGLRSSLFIIIVNNQPILHTTLPIRYPPLFDSHHYYPHIITLNIAAT